VILLSYRRALIVSSAISGLLSIALTAAPAAEIVVRSIPHPAAPISTTDLPIGRFRRQFEALPIADRAKVLEEFRRSPSLLKDHDSLHVYAGGHLCYSCRSNFSVEEPEAAPIAQASPLAEAEAASYAAVGNVSVSPFPSQLKFHSNSGSQNVIYLNFSGETIANSVWQNEPTWAPGPGVAMVVKPFNIAGEDPAVYSDLEQQRIFRIWLRVAEDFAPFDVDVTTERPSAAMFATNRVVHVVFSEQYDANGNQVPRWGQAAGFAMVNVFGSSQFSSYYSPAWVLLNVTQDRQLADVASHESGHNFGLSHDGATGKEYYDGHGSGETQWNTIMGNTGLNRAVSQWSQGEYYQANNTEDDLAILASKLGYRTDDHDDTHATATPLVITSGNTITSTTLETDPTNTSLPNKGIISSDSDVDVFRFDTGAGSISLTAMPFRIVTGSPIPTSRGTNLDIQLQLYNSAGNLVASANPSADTIASITQTLAAGRYFLHVKGSGTGTPLSSTPTGYTAYGSIGQFSLSGTIQPVSGSLLVVSAAAPFTVTGNLGGPFTPSSITYNLENAGTASCNWTLTKSANWLTMDSSSGTLAAGASTSVTVSLNANADSLGGGNHSDTLTFTNNTTGSGNIAHPVSLTVNRPPIVDAGAARTVSLGVPQSWTPVRVIPLAWFDAADASTLTLASSTVSQWRDKSGKNRHVDQATSSSRPIFDTDAVAFDGIDDHLWNSSPFLFARGSSDFFVVGSVAAATDRRIIAEAGSTTNAPIYAPAQTKSTSGSVMSAFIRNNSNESNFLNSVDLSPIGAFDNSTKIYHWSDTGSNMAGRVNGGAPTSSSYTRSGAFTLNRFAIGALLRASAASAVQATLREIIITSNLTDDDRAMLEGHLAHKWNVAANLSASHPFKEASPLFSEITTNLAGTASDPDGNSLNTAWSVLSGPLGRATITNPSSLTSAVTFSAPGTYVLRLTVNDGSAVVTGDVTFTVNPATPFQIWAAANDIIADPHADPDGDGFNNLQEFAFGMSPVTGGGTLSYIPGGAATSSGPPLILNTSPSGDDFRAIFARRKDHAAAGLTYTVQFSADLTQWVSSTETPTVLTGDGTQNPSEIQVVSVPYLLAIPVLEGYRKPTFSRIAISMN